MQTKSLVQSASFRCLLASKLYRFSFSQSGSILHVHAPVHIGFLVSSITKICSNGTTVTIHSSNIQVSFWLAVSSYHVVIL